MKRINGHTRSRVAAIGGGGIALAFFGLQPVWAQTYTYSNANGFFSNGFTPKLTTGSSTATLAFGGLGYTATDNLTNAVSLNTLSFTNGGAVVLGRGTDTGDSNTLNFNGPSSAIFLGNSTGTVGIGLDLNLGLHGINIDGSNTVNVSASLSGVISGTGFVDLLGNTTTLALTNLNNTYSGGTVFAGGTINIAGDGSLGATTTNSGQPNLDFAGGTLQFGADAISLNANRNVVLETYNGNTIDTQSFGSTIAGVVSGAGGLTVKGTSSGALALTGSNTYTGGTTIASGTLTVHSDSNLGAVPSNASTNITIDGGGTLELASAGMELNAKRNISLVANGSAAGPTIFVDHNNTASIDGVISGTGGLNVTSEFHGTLNLNGVNTYTGGITVNSGKIGIKNDSSLGAVPASEQTNLTLTDASIIVNSQSMALNAQRDIALNGADTIASGVGSSYLQIGGAVSGTGSLNVTNSTVVYLTGSNSWSGTTQIDSGSAVYAGVDGTTGTLGTGSVVNNGSLAFDRSNALNVANNISGTGTVFQQGSGTTTVSGSNTYSGGTMVTAGTLELAAAAADGSGSLLVDGPHSVVQLDITGALGGGAVTLANGGTIVNNAGGGAGGHSLTGPFVPHGAGSGALFTGLGPLSLGPGTSFIDFGAGNNGATFGFSSAGTFSGTLEILNWNDAPGADGGLDNILFGDGTSPALTADQLADIEFVNPDGMTGTYTAQQGTDGSLFASTTQIGGAAAAPEPGSVALLGLGGLPIGIGLLRRRRQA